MESSGGKNQIMHRTKHRESGLDEFLRKSLALDSEFRPRYIAEARKLPSDSCRRALRGLVASPIGHDRY